MKKLILVFAAIVLLGTSAFSQTNKDYAKTFEKYYDISGSGDAMKMVLDYTSDMLKKTYPNVKSQEIDNIINNVIKESMMELIEKLIPYYKKELSQKDLEELIKFYESPMGQKLKKANSTIAKESLNVSQEWGIKLSEKMMKEIDKLNK